MNKKVKSIRLFGSIFVGLGTCLIILIYDLTEFNLLDVLPGFNSQLAIINSIAGGIIAGFAALGVFVWHKKALDKASQKDS